MFRLNAKFLYLADFIKTHRPFGLAQMPYVFYTVLCAFFLVSFILFRNFEMRTLLNNYLQCLIYDTFKTENLGRADGCESRDLFEARLQ